MKTRGGVVIKQEQGVKRAANRNKGNTSSSVMVLPDEKLVKKLSRFSDLTDQETFESIADIPFGSPRSVCWDSLKRLGLADSVKEHVDRGGFQPFFEMEEPSYKELTLEFLSTFKVDPKITNPDAAFHFQFRLMGHHQNPSLNTFNVLLGCVPDDEAAIEEYSHFLTATPKDFDPHVFWRQISGEAHFDSKLARGSSILEYPMRILHKLVSGTIFARENQANVTLLDLTALWSMVTGRRLNLGHYLGEYLLGYHSKKLNGIYCGNLVTRIAEAIGVFKPDDRSRLTLSCHPDPMNFRTLQYMGYCKQVNKKWVLVSEIDVAAKSETRKRKLEIPVEPLVIEDGGEEDDEPKDAAYYRKCLSLNNEEMYIQLKAQSRKSAKLEQEVALLKKAIADLEKSVAWLHGHMEIQRNLSEFPIQHRFNEETLRYEPEFHDRSTPAVFRRPLNLNNTAGKDSELQESEAKESEARGSEVQGDNTAATPSKDPEAVTSERNPVTPE
ncbi:hypothetical protein M5689_004058 [Euphorbia peplus]|nr:hypothetical protein M5689_004058 [Euphorbia peplus]